MKTHYPPGPRDWLFGLTIGFRSLREPLAFLQEMARDHGDIAYVHVGPFHSYVINHPNLIREVLVTKGKSFRKWEAQKRVFRKIDGNGLINSEGDFWLRQRRLIQKAFQHRRLGRYADMAVELTRRRLDRWTAGAAINLDREMSELALEIAGATLFGVDMRDQAVWLGETAEVLRETFIREFLAPVPLPDWLPLPSKRRMRRAIRGLDAFITGIIRDRRASGEDKGDLLSILLLAVDEQGDGTGMTDLQARDEAVTLFNAGHDSTSAALAWTCYFIARYPGVQERLRNELETVLGGRVATFEDLPRLTFADTVVKESLPPGVGKSRYVRQALAPPAGWLSGQATPLGIYLEAYAHRHRPLVLDDIDGLYADRSGIRLLKALCQSEPVKTLGWHTTTPLLERRDVPYQFSTTSRVALIGNDWKTLNADVAALEDRGHVLVFEPTALEVHRQAAGWFWDQEIFDFVAAHLHLIAQHSLRTYGHAWELKQAGLDWRRAVLSRCLRGPALLVARLQADRSLASEAARVRAFIEAGAGCRATYYQHARKLRPPADVPKIVLTYKAPPNADTTTPDHLDDLRRRYGRLGDG